MQGVKTFSQKGVLFLLQNIWTLWLVQQPSYHFPPLTHSTVSDWYEAVNWNFDAFFPTRCSRFQTEVIFHLFGSWRPLSPTTIHCLLIPSTIIDNTPSQLCCRVFLISHRILFVLIDYRSIKPKINELVYPQCLLHPGLFSNHGIRHISCLRSSGFGFVFWLTGEVGALLWNLSLRRLYIYCSLIDQCDVVFSSWPIFRHGGGWH